MSGWHYSFGIVGGACLVVFIVFCASGLGYTEREVEEITNVHGIPFTGANNGVVITQALAHTDIHLREPVAFKRLVLTFDFAPLDTQSLAVGVRENDFWLSYTPSTFYEFSAGIKTTDFQTAIIEIPLTDKLQDVDRSLDVMFVANKQTESSLRDELADTTKWQIRNVRARVIWAWPTWVQLKGYGRSVITRERPL